MTASIERRALDSGADGPLGERRRAVAEQEQRAVLPRGEVVVTCSAPRETGGLGRHLGELARALEAANGRTPICIDGERGAPDSVLDSALDAGSAWRGGLHAPAWEGALAALALPIAPGVRTWAHMRAFDKQTARALPRAEHLIAFNGQALAQLRAARAAGYRTTSLVSANSHMQQVLERHELARRRYPLEGSWAAHMLRRNLAEYEQAERIYFASDYIRESFLQRGVPAERLARFPLTPAQRFLPAEGRGVERPASGSSFEIVYVGSLAVHKGVPLLIDAFRRLGQAELKLRLVGGWGSRGMRRFVQAACAADSRIVVSPGDPLPYLRGASLCVHAAYEDGFGYAPAEALAAGVPVLVSEDTGMKELIGSARDGLVLPTGDADALSEAIEAAYRGEILAG
jgi:glycosyltransferase involved in cell wall biosynthesis